MNTIDKIRVRMYRIGTGDCFLLHFYENDNIPIKMMIDCGAFGADKKDFEKVFDNIYQETGGIIDILVVTHEHSDHTNGLTKFQKSFYEKFNFKKVWFAWTEADEPFANLFRKEHVKIKKVVKNAVKKLNAISTSAALGKTLKNYESKGRFIAANEHFLQSMNFLNNLHTTEELSENGNIATLSQILKEKGIISDSTKVEFLQPGQVIENQENAQGIRFLVLGLPKDYKFVKITERKNEGYDERDEKGNTDLLFRNLMMLDNNSEELNDLVPFEANYIADKQDLIAKEYLNPDFEWRKIDNEWLNTSASLAMRLENLTNNTSLVLAIQFINSEKVLLFSGDAQHGNWLSWHENLKWKIVNSQNKSVKVDVNYILQNTVLYKAGHHLSHNGTLKAKGLELMTHDDFAAIVSLDPDSLGGGWDSTMPNDQIGEELIRRSNGKILFLGDRNKIIGKIKTDRTSISQLDMKTIEDINSPFDGQIYIDYTING